MEEQKRLARGGRFTSSQVYRLMKQGRGKGLSAPALTYIDEVVIERRMQSCIDLGGHSEAIAWGNFMEMVVFNHLGLQYRNDADESKLHPDPFLSQYWSGSCDLVVADKKVGEIKCYQKKKFAQYTDAILSQDVEVLRKDFPAEYWQIVSNAVINEVDYGEAISFMPYESELEAIRELVEDYLEPDQWKYRFIYEKPAWALAVLPDGGYYKNLNIFEFKIPEQDKVDLTDRIKVAIEKLEEKTLQDLATVLLGLDPVHVLK